MQQLHPIYRLLWNDRPVLSGTIVYPSISRLGEEYESASESDCLELPEWMQQ